jgi:hypothetical protein
MRTLAEWLTQVENLARAGLRGTRLEQSLDAAAAVRLDFAKTFADDFGHRRAVDPPLLAWVMRVPPWREPDPARLDVRLWHALHSRDLPPEASRGEGPLSPADRRQGIEVWTEIELASLQALWWHARLRRDPTLRERAESLARWLMAEMQPDNATNRPWAVATFAELAAAGDTDAALYADTLLHNCQVTLGRPDLFSTVLLLDARRSLARLGADR